ncbi:MAG TPA: cupin domain-containing protein [Terriglobales bacterium]|nr:cupin domain-containing protein [Terriglobales bacterium]
MTRNFHQLEPLLRAQKESRRAYLEFLRVPSMSAGIYCLPKGGADPQKPHQQDEMYYVVSGRSRMQVGAEHREVVPGSIIFVEARVEHRFYDITEDLVVVVFFAPAESDSA